MHSCAVLVVSSDGYKDLWRPFFHLFRHYWPDCPFPVYLGANLASAYFPGVTMLSAGAEHSWSANLRSFLNQLESENVLLLHEDFFLCERVSSEKILERLAELRGLKGTVLRLHPNPAPTIRMTGHPRTGEQHRLAPFRVSLQAALWNRAALLALLRDGESPWDFELQGTLRSQAQAHGYYCTFRKEFPYRQVVEEGRWFWRAARDYRAKNIGCDFSARPVMGPLTAARKVVVAALRRARDQMLLSAMCSPERDPYSPPPTQLALRVALLTNMIPPYHKPVLDRLAQRYAALLVLLSTPMEANRPWKVDWHGLHVVVQKTYTVKGVWRHARGFSEPLAIHIPLDTLGQLARYAPDVIISGEMGARTLLALVFRKLNPGSRLIIWSEAAESTENGRGVARHIARKFFVRNADAFLAVGPSTVKYLERMGAPRTRIFKIGYTTDIERFAAYEPTRLPESSHRLLFCGQLIERKGLLPFIDILSKWAGNHPAREVSFALAGDGPLRDAIARLPVASNLKIELLGVFDYEGLPAIYRSAGIFVLPTLADTWAVVINEALAAGLPVLGSIHAQAVQELIHDGQNGWIFRADSPEDTYRAIERALNTTDAKLAGMRAQARRTAFELTPERVAELIGTAVEGCTRR